MVAKGKIVNITYPEYADVGQAVTIKVDFMNVGDVYDLIWIEMIDIDTGEYILMKTGSYLDSGETAYASRYGIAMPDRVWNIRINCYHGVDILDDFREIRIKLPEKPLPLPLLVAIPLGLAVAGLVGYKVMK